MLLPHDSAYNEVKFPSEGVVNPISQLIYKIEMTFQWQDISYRGSIYPMRLMGVLYDQTVGVISNMAAFKPDVHMS